MGVMSRDTTVLSFEQFTLLHRIILSWPEGLSVSGINIDVHDLLSLKLIEQKGAKYFPTEAGVNHMMPKHFVAR
jgi:hypothetical protein